MKKRIQVSYTKELQGAELLLYLLENFDLTVKEAIKKIEETNNDPKGEISKEFKELYN